MPKAYACCWLDELSNGIEADQNVVHYIPWGNFRVTKCGRITGIIQYYLTAKELYQINDRLCLDCFSSSKSKIIKEKLKKQEASSYE